MTDLRDKIGGIVFGVAQDKYGTLKWPEATDRIIALITEALLSEHAVEAGVIADREYVGTLTGAHKARLSATLAAAGLTTGGQGG